MKRTFGDYLMYGIIAVGVFLLVVIATNRIKSRGEITSRAIDTVNVGTTPNDGTGDPLRTAFLKLNRLIVMADSLDLELLTNDEMQALKDIEELTDAVLFPPGDTTVTAELGKVVYKSSNNNLYVCRALTGHKWYQLNN